MNIYFIADTHFTEENIIKYENRPFKNVQEMDDSLINAWNKIVTDEDMVYVLGDFGGKRYEKFILSELNGKKYLIKGNHDENSNEYYRNSGFVEVYDHPIILNNFWILSHEPLYVNENMPYANIFGHVHNSPIYKTYSKNHYCVSVERTNWSPVSFDTIMKKVKKGDNDE